MKKSYYAIIPANVRYDENLPPNAKLLYGEITALCNQEGFCWANNNYFSSLYGVTNRTIRSWLTSLERSGYIKREVVRNKDKQVEQRKIYIIRGMEENFHPYGKNLQEGMEENFRYNNTSFNNTKEYIYTLFDYWIEKDIIKHRSMNQQMKSHINARLKDYSVDELKKAIDNYSTVVNSDDYFFDYKWTLQDFMKPRNVSRFVDDAEPLDNFRKDNKNSNGNRKVARF